MTGGPFRRVVTTTEEILLELGQPVSTPVRRAAAAAVIANPWTGRGVVADLAPEVERVAPGLAVELVTRLTAALGTADDVLAYGKAALVGLDGEIEHAAALVHTPYFGNVFRELVDGTSVIVWSDDRVAAGTPLTLPLWHKTASTTRSCYQTMQVRVPDAPRPDEIVVVAAAAASTRPNPRIGDRSTDPAVSLTSLEVAR